MPLITLILAISAGIVVGAAAGYYLRYLVALGKKASIELSIKEKLVEAEEKALKIVEKAENKAETLLAEAKAEEKATEEKLDQKESHLQKRE